MSGFIAASPFEYDPQAKAVRSIEPAVRIILENHAGGADGYKSYSVAILYNEYQYCFRANYDYLRDGSGSRVENGSGRPLGGEFTRLKTRVPLLDRASGNVLLSTFPDDDASYSVAVELAVHFYSAAQMLMTLAPIRWIRFDRSERVEPKSFEVQANV